MKIVTFLRKNGYHPKRVVDFPRERDTFRNKIMGIVKDFDEKSYNNNGKPWTSSRILRVKPNFFIFSLFIIFRHFFVYFLHFFVFFSFFIVVHLFFFSFFFIFYFFKVFHFSVILFHVLSFSFILFHFLSFFCHFISCSVIFYHVFFFFFFFFLIRFPVRKSTSPVLSSFSVLCIFCFQLVWVLAPIRRLVRVSDHT